MPDTYTPHAKLTQMETGSHESSWGDVINQVLELIEEMAWGYEVVAATGNPFALPAISAGASSTTRHAFLAITGPFAPATLTVQIPSGLARVFGIHNATNATMTVQHASGGASVSILTDKRALLLCTGTDVYLVSTTAKNATTLNGLASSAYAALGSANLFTKGFGQAGITGTGSASYTPDASLGNVFLYQFTGLTGTLNNPTNLMDGQELVFLVAGATMTTLNKGSKFRFPGGAAANPYSGAGNVDMIRGRYVLSDDLIYCERIADLS